MKKTSTPKHKQILAVMMIFSLLVTFTPKQSEGVILLSVLVQGMTYTFSHLIGDMIITCIFMCDGGGGGGGDDDCPYTPGETCGGTDACGNPAMGVVGGNCECEIPIDALDDCGVAALGDPPIVITPPIVRRGDTINIAWDVGANPVEGCALTGPGIGTFDLEGYESTDSIDTTATDPHVFVLTCVSTQDGEEDSISAAEQVRIAGESTEF
ncbi:hypothetical protein CL653_03155 [bacterium]|nr:hypothetical protein [bacterium]|tara:strand:+ start:1353 stop:1985 length:633 start_codon:yes stop_codon:yes gene_type:complete